MQVTQCPQLVLKLNELVRMAKGIHMLQEQSFNAGALRLDLGEPLKVEDRANLLAFLDSRPPSLQQPGDAISQPQTGQPPVEAQPAGGSETASQTSDRNRNGDRTSDRHHRRRPSDAASELKKDLPPEANLRDGDIIFVSSSAFDEARAIQKVSNSPLTHCGILFKEGNDWYVYEAAQPVKKTLLKDFHRTDNGETYVVRRLKHDDIVLTPKVLEKMHNYLKENVDKEYDHMFGWGNDKMYCSELVWKAYYEAARVKVGQIKMVGDFDFSDPLVKRLVEERYGKNVPITEPTITPGGVYDSRLLRTVK